MILRTKKPTVRSILNKLLRRPSRILVTKLGTNTVTIKTVYKNKQIIEVASGSLNRCAFRI